MLNVIVCIVILIAVCCAQEHLTCLRTTNVLTQESPQISQRALQGPPGKRGAKGQVGSRGSPGQKGEPGIPDNRQINLLQDQFNSLLQEVEVLKNQSKDNFQLILARNKWLYLPPDLHIYQLSPGSQSWQKSQEFCQNWGGNLAMHGVKSREKRQKLIQYFSANDIYFWIGLNDIASEGNWVWVNDEQASSFDLHWRRGEPNNQGNEDCAVVSGYSQQLGLAVDVRCTATYRGLCEKKI